MVSILMAVYNGALHLKNTLKSIEDQTYPNWELIAVDDASRDNTPIILQDFQKRFPRKVVLLHNKHNQGLTRSLIIAAQQARGEYLARLDAGDEFLPEKLERQVNFLQTHPDYGLISCNYINIFLPNQRQKKSQVPLTDQKIRRSILKKNPFAHSCIQIRKDIYEKAGGYNPTVRYGQDYDLWFRVLRITKAANLPEYLCRRTMNENAISYQKQKEQMRQCLKTQWKYMNKFNPKHYFYLLEPLSLIFLPGKIKKFLRHL